MTLRFSVPLILGALLWSESAFALSCARPNLMQTLEEAKSSDKVYHILMGRFVTKTRPTSETVQGSESFRSQPPTLTQSWFEGRSVSHHSNTDVRLTRFPVDIETSCIGPWCSSLPSGNETLIAFVEARQGQSPILRISPCPKSVYPADVKGNLRSIRQGLRN